MSAIAQLMLAGAPLPPSAWAWASVFQSYDSWDRCDVSNTGSKMIIGASGNSKVRISLDGGVSWVDRSSHFNNHPSWGQLEVRDVAVASNGSRFAVCWYSSGNAVAGCSYSVDDGVTWSSFTFPYNIISPRSIDITGNGTWVFVACDYGDWGAATSAIMVSSDGGANFTAKQSNVSSWSRIRANGDGSPCYVVDNPYGLGGALYRSEDKFNSLVNLQGNVGANVRSIDISDNGNDIVASLYGYISYIRRSTNKGDNFTTITTPIGDQWRVGISGDKNVLAIAAGGYGYFYTSSNGGLNWLYHGGYGSGARFRLSYNGRKILLLYDGSPYYSFTATATN